MVVEPDNLALSTLREMRVDMASNFERLDEILQDGRRRVASLDMHVEALDESVEMIREGTVSAIGFAPNARRAFVDPHKQNENFARRVEKLEAAK